MFNADTRRDEAFENKRELQKIALLETAQILMKYLMCLDTWIF